MSYTISQVSPRNKRLHAQMITLLEEEGISLDSNLDYSCVLLNDQDDVIATGSCFGNTLRCLAVSSQYQGEGLLNQVVTHLIHHQINQGNHHLFVYTKVETAQFFASLGFYELARVSDTLVFLENKRDGFSDFLQKLQPQGVGQNVGALVMNANPFTKGHLYLVEKASKDCQWLHLFLVSEDVSLVPFSVRKRLVEEGTAHLTNLSIHETGNYIISNATFPSYFLKDEEKVMEGHARLDVAIFQKIADHLGISKRYVGEEPTSAVTNLYNRVMSQAFPCEIVPRKEENDQVISASTVRQALKEEDWTLVEAMLPPSSLRFFQVDEGKEVIERLKNAKEVRHH